MGKKKFFPQTEVIGRYKWAPSKQLSSADSNWKYGKVQHFNSIGPRDQNSFNIRYSLMDHAIHSSVIQTIK